MSAVDKLAVEIRIIHLANKLHPRKLVLHLAQCPVPELHRHHLCHVTAESINALGSPEAQDLQHLMPCVGHRGEVFHSAGAVIDAIVELDGLIPVITVGLRTETVVASGLCGHLVVRLRL